MYSIKTKILVNAGYWLLCENCKNNNNSQQENTICPKCKNHQAVPAKYRNRQTAKINSHKHSGRFRGGARSQAPRLFSDQTVEKIFLETGPHFYLRIWMTAPPPPPYLKVWICHWNIWCHTVIRHQDVYVYNKYLFHLLF